MKDWRTKYELLFLEKFVELSTLLTLPLFLLCQYITSGDGLHGHRHQGGQYPIFLPHFAYLSSPSLSQRPWIPCNKILALVGCSYLLDVGASDWFSLISEESRHFVMPEGNGGWWSSFCPRTEEIELLPRTLGNDANGLMYFIVWSILSVRTCLAVLEHDLVST